MLPDMSDVLPEWEQPILVKTKTVTRVNFVDTVVVTSANHLAVVQPAQKEQLSPDSIDWSKEYIQVHDRQQIDIGQFIQWQGRDFKIIQRGSYGQYGYYEVFAEETKLPLLQVTP